MKQLLRIVVILQLFTLAYASQCNENYDPKDYMEAPQSLKFFLKENGIALKKGDKGLPFFKDLRSWGNGGFVLDDHYHDYLVKPNSTVKNPNENAWYAYTISSGIFNYDTRSNRISSIGISKILDGKYLLEDVTKAVMDKFGLWNKENGRGSLYYNGNGRNLKVGNIYFTIFAEIKGFEGDKDRFNAKALNTSIEYVFSNHTKEVNKHINCKQKYNKFKQRGKNLKL